MKIRKIIKVSKSVVGKLHQAIRVRRGGDVQRA